MIVEVRGPWLHLPLNDMSAEEVVCGFRTLCCNIVQQQGEWVHSDSVVCTEYKGGAKVPRTM